MTAAARRLPHMWGTVTSACAQHARHPGMLHTHTYTHTLSATQNKTIHTCAAAKPTSHGLAIHFSAHIAIQQRHVPQDAGHHRCIGHTPHSHRIGCVRAATAAALPLVDENTVAAAVGHVCARQCFARLHNHVRLLQPTCCCCCAADMPPAVSIQLMLHVLLLHPSPVRCKPRMDTPCCKPSRRPSQLASSRATLTSCR